MVKTMTTLLTPIEVGKYSLASAAIAFFAMLFANPVGMLINRKAHQWLSNGKIASHLYIYFIYLFTISLLTAPIFFLTTEIFQMEDKESKFNFMIIYMISISFGTLVQTFIPTMNLLGKDKAFAFFSVSFTLMNLACSYAMVHLNQPIALFWLTGLAISQIFFFLLSWWFFFRLFNLKFSPDKIANTVPNAKQLRSVISFSAPIAITALLGWLHFQGYRFLISDSVGLREFGLFAAGYGLAASLLAAVEQTLAAWFQPRFYALANSPMPNKQKNAWVFYIDSTLPIATLAACTIAVSSPNLVPLFLGPAFASATPYVAAGVLAELGRIYLGAFMLRGHQLMKTDILITPTLIAVLIATVLLLPIQALGNLTWVPICLFLGALTGCYVIYRKNFANSNKQIAFKKIVFSGFYVLLIGAIFRLLKIETTSPDIATNLIWISVKALLVLPVLIWLLRERLPKITWKRR